MESDNMALPAEQIGEIVRRALAEDAAHSDVTTAATVDPSARGRGIISAKANGVIAGTAVAEQVFRAVDPGVTYTARVMDGEAVAPGVEVAVAAGSLASILIAERTALNFLMRMSGIATLTARFVGAVQGTRARIVDTRKTAPGLRLLDKYAVRMGGGGNHRFGLSDGVLIKDNHIAAAGGIRPAIERSRASVHHLLKIEVEVTTVEELQDALAGGADAVLLDNMTAAELAECVEIVAGRALCEASGGVTLDNVRTIAETGVDLISVGQLTHSAPALDLSLQVTSS